MAEAHPLTIVWLYPQRMNIYGDRGNVIAMQRRAEWRGVPSRVVKVEIGDTVPDEADVFFFGGGQDQEQRAVSEDLQGAKGEIIRSAIEDGAALLAVCGGYQLLGHVYRPFDEDPLPGIGVFDVQTDAGEERFIGNVIVESQWGSLVGFENHSGLTRLGPGAKPMGTVQVGRGNNGEDGTEGTIYRNAVGCYLHGSILPKNPMLADWLIEAGLRRRKREVYLPSLGDELESKAHGSAMSRAKETR